MKRRWQANNTYGATLLVGILVLAAGARVGVAILTTSWVFPKDGNSWSFGFEMGQIAASVAVGNGFSWPEWSGHLKGPTAWVPPVYPFLIAVIFKVFGVYSEQSAICILLLQTILSVLTCFFLYSLGKRVFNIYVGLLAAFFFCVYPPSIHFAVQKVWSTSLFSCCLLVLILRSLKLRTQMNLTGGLWLGGLAGFTALVDPIVVSCYPFGLLWLYVNSKRDGLATGKVLAVTVVAVFLTVCPWLIRNYVVFGQLVFIKSNFGNELFRGNNRDASGNFQAPESTLSGDEKALLDQSDESTRNRFLLQKALAFVSTHPLQFLRLTMSRFVHYWTFMMRPATGWGIKVSLVSYFAVLALGIMSLLFSNIRAPDVQLLWLFIMALPLPYYVTWVTLFRFRFPVETVLMVLAAFTVVRVVSWSRALATGSAYGQLDLPNKMVEPR